MIFTILGVLLLLYSISNFKSGFTLYMAFQIFYCPNAKIANLSGIPSIPIYLFLSLAFVLLYHIKYRRIYKNEIKFPLIVPFAVMFVSRFASCFTSLEGFSAEFARSMGFLFNGIIEVWIIWQVFETEEDFRKLLKYFCYSFLLVGIYGCIEYAIGSNFIFEYKQSLLDSLTAYREDGLRGYRLMSVFEHPIGAGMNCAAFIVFYFLARFKFQNIYSQKKLGMVVCLLCLVCIFFTKMRSGIFFLLVGCLSFIDLKSSNTYKFLLGVMALAFFALPFLGEYANVFYSLFDSNAAESVGGSSADMRLDQLSASLYFLSLSPIAGFGDQALENLTNVRASDLLALESVYFEEMVKHGGLGLLGVFVSMYYTVFKVPRLYKSMPMCIVSLAFWLTYSMTSIPCFRMNLYYILLFCCIKMSNVYHMKS